MGVSLNFVQLRQKGGGKDRRKRERTQAIPAATRLGQREQLGPSDPLGRGELALGSFGSVVGQRCGHQEAGADDDRQLELLLNGQHFGLSIAGHGD